MVARVSLPGYATHEIALTEGPMQWIDLHGRNHGQYWLFKSDHFEVQLDPVGSTFTGSVTATLTPEAIALRPELSLEEIVRRTKPAVVYLKALDKSGTGFFVTDTGVLATNAHVARGVFFVVAVLADGVQLEVLAVCVAQRSASSPARGVSPLARRVPRWKPLRRLRASSGDRGARAAGAACAPRLSEGGCRRVVRPAVGYRHLPGGRHPPTRDQVRPAGTRTGSPADVWSPRTGSATMSAACLPSAHPSAPVRHRRPRARPPPTIRRCPMRATAGCGTSPTPPSRRPARPRAGPRPRGPRDPVRTAGRVGTAGPDGTAGRRRRGRGGYGGAPAVGRQPRGLSVRKDVRAGAMTIGGTGRSGRLPPQPVRGPSRRSGSVLGHAVRQPHQGDQPARGTWS